MQKNILTIITQEFESAAAAQLFAEQLRLELAENATIKLIEPYYKFENSYSIDFEILTDFSAEQLIAFAISLTNRLSSPWLVYYDNDSNFVELIFNKSNHSYFPKPEFNAMRWAHWQTV